MIAFLQRKSTVGLSLVSVSTYFGILFLEKNPDFYSAFSPVHFLKGLSLAILCLFQGPFSTFWYDTKKITCISQRVMTLLVQKTSGEDE